VTEPDPEVDAARVGEAFGQPRVYERREVALARFRTVPPQEHYLDYVMADPGPRSLGEVEGGWCRLALLRSEFGLVTEDIGAYIYDLLGRLNPVIEIPQTGHHLMLDQPLLVMTALNTLLADWDHSEPRRRSR
jgi:hypothetical protein